jgi:hypothetical protein
VCFEAKRQIQKALNTIPSNLNKKSSVKLDVENKIKKKSARADFVVFAIQRILNI